jgi:hypothetical protein
MGKTPIVFVCCGESCRSRKKARKALVAALEPVAVIEHVDCQKICAGPVAGLEVAGKLEWFSDLRSDKARRKLVKLVEEGKLAKSLQRRWVRKRSGKKRSCQDGSTPSAGAPVGGDAPVDPEQVWAPAAQAVDEPPASGPPQSAPGHAAGGGDQKADAPVAAAEAPTGGEPAGARS